MKSELELKIDELEIIRTALELKFEKFKDREQELKLGVMKEIFSKCLPEGYELKSRYDQWSIEFINNDKKFGDEIMSFRTLKSYEPKSRHLLDQISISTYSTSSHSEFELNRYIIIGKVAEVLKPGYWTASSPGNFRTDRPTGTRQGGRLCHRVRPE